MLALAVLVGFAAFRCSRLIALDTILDGPRHRFYRRFPPKEPEYYLKVYRLGKTWQVGDRPRRKPSFLGQLVSCPWCSSVWFAAGIVAILAWKEPVPDPILVWAGACSVAGICGTIAG